MKRIVIVIVSMLLLLVSVAHAQDDPKATISTSELRVRELPSSTANVVGTLGLNSVVSLLGREDQQGNGGVWVYVTNGGVTGWVLADFLVYNVAVESLPLMNPTGGSTTAPAANTTTTTTTTQTEAPAAAAPAPVSVEGGVSAQVVADANVRQAPDATSGRIAGVFAGSTVTLVGRSSDSQWVRAVVAEGSGWISARLVQASAPISSLPVTTATGEVVSGGTAANTTTSTTSTTTLNVAPPVISTSRAGFVGYGAHVNGFGGTELMSGIGMTWVKKQVRYNRGDSPNNYAWMITEGHARGFRVLLGVVGLRDDPTGGDAYFAEYANFVAGLASLGADAIEVWNEPNLDREWPNGLVDGALYTRLLAVSYNAIKGANPNTLVISGAPAPTGFFGGCSPAGCDDKAYLDQMRAAGAAQYMDCVGAHYNEGIVAPNVTSGDPRSEYYTRYFVPMINTYASAMGKPVCFTELGYVTGEGYGGMPAGFEWGGENTLAEQATWVAQAISIGSSNANVKMVIIWNFNFVTDAGAADPAGGYAMLRPDGSCPACDALRR